MSEVREEMAAARRERESQLHGRIGGLRKQVGVLEKALLAERQVIKGRDVEIKHLQDLLVAAAINAGGTLRISDEALAQVGGRAWKTWHDPAKRSTMVQAGPFRSVAQRVFDALEESRG